MNYSDIIGKKVINIDNAQSLGQAAALMVNGLKIDSLLTSSGVIIKCASIHSISDNVVCRDLELPAVSNGAAVKLPDIGSELLSTDGQTLGSIIDYEITATKRISVIITNSGEYNARLIHSLNGNTVIIKGKKILKKGYNTSEAAVKTEKGEAAEPLAESISDALTANINNVPDNCPITMPIEPENNNDAIAVNEIDTFPYAALEAAINPQIDDADNYEITDAQCDSNGVIVPTIISDYNFLIGRRVNRTIYSKSGEVLVAKGGVIDKCTLNIAIVSGKLVELAIYSNANNYHNSLVDESVK